MLERLSLRKQFEKNYTAVCESAKDGSDVKVRYVYVGPWFVFEGDPSQVKKKKIAVYVLSVLSLIAFCAAFFIRGDLSRSKLIMVPAMAALCFHMLELAGALQLVLSKEKITNLAFERIDRSLGLFSPIRTALMAVASAICVCGVLNGASSRNELLISAGCVISTAAAFAVYRIYSGMRHHVVENEEAKARAAA